MDATLTLAARAALGAGDQRSARQAAESAVRSDPEFAEAWTALAMANNRLRRHLRAVRAARQAIRLTPQNPYGARRAGLRACSHHGADGEPEDGRSLPVRSHRRTPTCTRPLVWSRSPRGRTPTRPIAARSHFSRTTQRHTTTWSLSSLPGDSCAGHGASPACCRSNRTSRRAGSTSMSWENHLHRPRAVRHAGLGCRRQQLYSRSWAIRAGLSLVWLVLPALAILSLWSALPRSVRGLHHDAARLRSLDARCCGIHHRRHGLARHTGSSSPASGWARLLCPFSVSKVVCSYSRALHRRPSRNPSADPRSESRR